MGKWIKEFVVYTVEYYLAIKRKFYHLQHGWAMKHYAKWNKRRKANIIWFHWYVEFKQNKHRLLKRNQIRGYMDGGVWPGAGGTHCREGELSNHQGASAGPHTPEGTGSPGPLSWRDGRVSRGRSSCGFKFVSHFWTTLPGKWCLSSYTTEGASALCSGSTES